jgi:hypothetical protein
VKQTKVKYQMNNLKVVMVMRVEIITTKPKVVDFVGN